MSPDRPGELGLGVAPESELGLEDLMLTLEDLIQSLAGGEAPLEQLVLDHARAARLLALAQSRLDAARLRAKGD